jgi:asparagine synthase (glutamine-hydrolysing)
MLRSFWRGGLFEEPARRYLRLMDRFTDNRRLLNPALELDHKRTFESFRAIFQSHGAAAMINRILSFDLKAHLQALLHVDDRVNAAWGVECHAPFLDHRLIELVAAVPPIIKFKNGQLKYLFRQAVKNLLPPQIVYRKDKMGFPVPLTQWLRGMLRDFVGDILLSQRSRERGLFEPKALESALGAEQPFDRSLWGALCLETWHRQFVDRDGATSQPRAPEGPRRA